jgi:hypothetical protein
MLTTKSQKIAKKYICKTCDYNTSNRCDFNKHISTLKHTQLTSVNIKVTENVHLHTCRICNKTYKSRVGLWKHSKICNNDPGPTPVPTSSTNIDDTPSENIIVSKQENDISQLTSLVIEVVRNNSEFQKQMFDMCKNMQTTINSNCNNNNTTNNTFNLQVFLNEYCKDAMNINDFVDSFDLQVSDLENVGRLGYIEGMSNIIISKIKELDVNKRPIHCSDIKREIIYIKDNDIWEREDTNNSKFRKVIKRVSGKNIDMLNDWREMYPDCSDIDSENNEKYMKLIITSMGAEDISLDENKIMKRVVKHVVIDKKMLNI